MASQIMSKKRPAPGTSPASYQSSYPQPPGPANNNEFDPQNPEHQLLRYAYQQEYDSTRMPYSHQPAIQQQNNGRDEHGLSNQLARRPAGQVVRRDGPYPDSTETRVEGQTDSYPQRLDGAWGQDLNDLKQKAQAAKRDAQSKRKQIPPFVQKLASFTNDGKNTNLIRWADDGNSFIVEDEDEFAKKLIPELFKHNNYASFVRQLNMYGFHKKVGLSDNSMRASEKKSKRPSEYSNPYFRRGHPDLLWLIQKPRNAQGGRLKGSKRSDHDLNEDDFDDFIEEIPPKQDGGGFKPPALRLAIEQGRGSMPSEQLSNVHQELQTIRQHQTQITAMIQRLKREHEQLYGQAATFQDQHSRHENSINAILTFLATVYNRSIQGHEGVQGIANLFAGAVPQDSNQSHVLDVGDYHFDQLNGSDGPMQRQYKKPPLLLKAAPIDGSRVSTLSPVSGASGQERRPTRRMSQTGRNAIGQPSNVEELLDSPNQAQRSQIPTSTEPQSQNDILSVIQNSNARNSKPGTPAADFSNVLDSLEISGDGSPLTNTQRADVLRLISDQGSATNASNNTLIPPNPPPMSSDYGSRLAATQSDIENLAKMQADQDRSMQNLTNMLQPLSPTGSIPGIGDGVDVQPPPLDIDDFLSNNANYFTDFPTDNNYDLSDHNALKTQGPAINFADFDDGDDELFRSVDNTNAASATTNIGPGSEPLNNNQLSYSNHDTYYNNNTHRNNDNGLNLDGAVDDNNDGDDDDDDPNSEDAERDTLGIDTNKSIGSSEVTTPTNASSFRGGGDGDGGIGDLDGPWHDEYAAAAAAGIGDSPARKRKRLI